MPFPHPSPPCHRTKCSRNGEHNKNASDSGDSNYAVKPMFSKLQMPKCA